MEKIEVKISNVERRNNRFWKTSEMFTGRLYDTYINGQIVRSSFLEVENENIGYGEDSIQKDVEVHTYESFKEYEEAGWWMEDKNSILLGDTAEELIELAKENNVRPYAVVLMN